MKKAFLALFGLLLVQGVALAGEDRGVKLSGKTESITPSSRVFSDLRYLKQDKWGNVFAVDEKESVVVKYDSSLKFVTSFGRNGKGPGEFMAQPVSKKDILQVMSNGDVWVADSNPSRFVIFSNDGRPKEEIRLIDIRPEGLDMPLYNHIPLTANVFGAIKNLNNTKDIYDDPIRQYLLIRIKPAQILCKTDNSDTRLKMEYKGWWVIGTRDLYWGDSGKIVTDGKRIAIMKSQQYEVIVYHEETGKTVTLKKECKKTEFTDAELAALKIESDKAHAKVPGMSEAFITYIRPRKNVLMDVQINNGFILVFPVPADISRTNRYTADVWDSDGKYLYSAHFPMMPVHINNNMAYAVERNDEDDPVIVRWKMDE